MERIKKERMIFMELVQALNQTVTNDREIGKKQNSFLDTTLGKVINSGVNLGLKVLLPDFIEDQVIGVKDTLLREGLGEGIKKAISSAVDIGKNAIGMVTNSFQNISQAQSAVQKGGIVEGISDSLDYVLEKTENKELLSNDITNTLKNGKNTILENVSTSIENEFKNQIKSLEKIQKYSNNWKEYFNNKNYDGMTKELYKLNNEIKKVLPMEKILNDARTIQNLHSLIKNNGKDFNLTEEQLQLAQMLN